MLCLPVTSSFEGCPASYWRLTMSQDDRDTISVRNTVWSCPWDRPCSMFVENFQQIDPLTTHFKYITNLCVKTKVVREKNTQQVNNQPDNALTYILTCATGSVHQPFTRFARPTGLPNLLTTSPVLQHGTTSCRVFLDCKTAQCIRNCIRNMAGSFGHWDFTDIARVHRKHATAHKGTKDHGKARWYFPSRTVL